MRRSGVREVIPLSMVKSRKVLMALRRLAAVDDSAGVAAMSRSRWRMFCGSEAWLAGDCGWGAVCNAADFSVTVSLPPEAARRWAVGGVRGDESMSQVELTIRLSRPGVGGGRREMDFLTLS